MPRGRVRAIYVTDIGPAFFVWVDRDSVLDANRGWVEAPLGASTPLGRGVLPRRVVGVDELGDTRFARIATVTAPLWTGQALSWQFEGSDGLLHTATRVARQEERRTA